MDKLNIGFLSTTYHTSLLLIAEKWVEEKLNIEVNWKLYASGPDEVNALSRREIDIGYIGLPPVIIGIHNRVPIKCIAAGHVEGSILIAENSFKSFKETGSIPLVLKQFIGKTIASPPKGSIHDIIIRKLIQEYGVEGIEVKNFPWADLILDDFTDKKICAAVGTPSLAVAAMQFSNGKVLIPSDKMWRNSPSYGIVARNDFIENHPEILQKFLSLHKKATDEIKINSENAAKSVSKLIGVVGEDFVSEVYKVSPKYFINLTDDFINSTKEFISTLIQLKYIKKSVSVEEIFDFRVIGRILNRRERYFPC